MFLIPFTREKLSTAPKSTGIDLFKEAIEVITPKGKVKCVNKRGLSQTCFYKLNTYICK